MDLAGVRIALYFPGDRREIDKFIKLTFEFTEEPKEFPGSSSPTYIKRFSGYWATHYRVYLKSSGLSDSQQRYTAARIDIQVASVLMHAWAEVEHDLVYKPRSGDLSEDEYAILDELNGLFLAGEIALERLQRAFENRVKGPTVQFTNHYELAGYLYEAIRPLFSTISQEPIMGRLDVLFQLLQKAGISRPETIEPLIQALDVSTETRPIAEQIIDEVLSIKPELYTVYSEIQSEYAKKGLYRSSKETFKSSEDQEAIGFFISQWILFERITGALVGKLEPKFKGFFSPSVIQFKKLQLFDSKTLLEIERIRRIRNNLVHGIEIPDSDFLRQSGESLSQIIEKLSSDKRDQLMEIEE